MVVGLWSTAALVFRGLAEQWRVDGKPNDLDAVQTVTDLGVADRRSGHFVGLAKADLQLVSPSRATCRGICNVLAGAAYANVVGAPSTDDTGQDQTHTGVERVEREEVFRQPRSVFWLELVGCFLQRSNRRIGNDRRVEDGARVARFL